uniref:Ig-like domain-containing protein n=1 Tax=Xiphophorus couchianus TaxID=32473 RepID=A0A3B5MCM7_9TELE
MSPRSPSPTGLPPLTSSSSSMERTTTASCSLRISPSTLVLNHFNLYGLLFFSFLSFYQKRETQETSVHTMESFLVWSVDSFTEWTLSPICYATSDEGGQCSSSLSVIVYQPPKTVSIRFLNQSGPMYERRQYLLQCTVEDVAPVENLVVTFYKGQTALAELRSNRTAEKTPVKESFSLLVAPCRGDNGHQYWCEAKLELGPSGPQQPPTQAISARYENKCYKNRPHFPSDDLCSNPPDLLIPFEQFLWNSFSGTFLHHRVLFSFPEADLERWICSASSYIHAQHGVYTVCSKFGQLGSVF